MASCALNTAQAQSPFQIGEETYYSTGLGTVLFASALLLKQSKPQVQPEDLQQLDRTDIFWSVDRKVAGNWNPRAGKISDYLLMSVPLAPLAYTWLETSSRRELGLMYVESLLLTASGTYLAKYSVDRLRPFSYHQDKNIALAQGQETNMSFFSGHTSTIANALFFTASSCSILHPDNSWCHAAWASAWLGTASMAWLRMEAGWHFPSDVLLGAIWGGLVGYSLPRWHKRKTSNSLQTQLQFQSPTTPLVSLRYLW